MSYLIMLVLLKVNLKERHLFVLKKLLKRSQIGFVSFILESVFSPTLYTSLRCHTLQQKVKCSSLLSPGAEMEIDVFSCNLNTEPHVIPKALIYRCICQHFPCSEITSVFIETLWPITSPPSISYNLQMLSFLNDLSFWRSWQASPKYSTSVLRKWQTTLNISPFSVRHLTFVGKKQK